MRTSKASFQGLLSLTKTCLLKFLPFLQVVPPAGDQVLNTPAWSGGINGQTKVGTQNWAVCFCLLYTNMGGGVKLNLCTLGKRSTAGRQLQVFFFNNTGNSYCL